MTHVRASRFPFKTRASRRWPALVLSGAALLAACGGAEVLLVPLFEFGFSGSTGTPPNDVQVQVFFLPDTPTQTSGTFDTVNINFNGNQVQYSGSFRSCEFDISTNAAVAAPAAARYSGRFNGNDRIELTPVGTNLPALSLQRQGVGTRVTGC